MRKENWTERNASERHEKRMKTKWKKAKEKERKEERRVEKHTVHNMEFDGVGQLFLVYRIYSIRGKLLIVLHSIIFYESEQQTVVQAKTAHTHTQSHACQPL